MNSVITNNLGNGTINIFEQWKRVQIKLLEIKNINLKEKQEMLFSFEESYDDIISNTMWKDRDSYEFNLSNLIRIVKYLNASNEFFNNRVTPDMMDEILLLVYLYEWLCLGREKDVSILGTKDDVIKKFQNLTIKNNSEYKKVFDDIDFGYDEDVNLFNQRIKNATFRAYNNLLNIIITDNEYFSKIKASHEVDLSRLDDKYFKRVWKETFSIEDERVTYSYSAENSDDTFIFINVETKNEQVAFVKFRMFETFSFKSGVIMPNGISKEILRIEFLNQKYENIGASILSNALKIANRVIKNIFLPEMRMKTEQNGYPKVMSVKKK